MSQYDLSGVSLQQIATAAGISQATASRALRGSSAVAPKTRRAVDIALRTLGVKVPADPDVKRIAVVTAAPIGPDIEPFTTLIDELTKRIFAVGHVAVQAVTDPSLPPTYELLSAVGVDGVIVVGGGPASSEAQKLAGTELPMLRISHARHTGFAQIIMDSSVGIETAVRHLVQLGHTRIGLAVPEDSAKNSRVSAFRTTMADLLFITGTRDQAPVVVSDPGLLAGAQAAEQLLDTKCTAVISASPDLTVGFLQAAQRLRLRVPEDLSFLAAGDVPDADVFSPPISQVTFDWEQLASTGVREIERLMAGPVDPLPAYWVEPELVLRSSDAPLARR